MSSISRKQFLRTGLAAAAGLAIPGTMFGSAGPQNRITILYTNDTHARLDPFPENAKQYAGLGGIARRANLINEIRKREKNVLLFDAGDVFQGTPWFDVYGGEVDLKLMSEMGYEAMAVGNHEFDNGPDGFAEAAQKAEFPILAANYDVSGTPLNSFVRKFITKEVDGLKIGIFGLGIRLDGLVSRQLYGDVRYRDPEVWAAGMVRSLRSFHRCDFIICLSHIGYQYPDNRIDDLKLASKVGGIDLIIGGHTHTFLHEPSLVMNPGGTYTIVTQAGHSGIRLGRIDINPDTWAGNRTYKARQYTIGEKI